MELRTIRRMFFHPGMILVFFLLQLRMCFPKIRFDHTRSISRCLICLPSCLICSINSDFGSNCFCLLYVILCYALLILKERQLGDMNEQLKMKVSLELSSVIFLFLVKFCHLFISVASHVKKSDFRTLFLSTPPFLVFTDVHLICTITLHMGKSVSKNSTWKGNLFISRKRGE